MTLGSFAPLLHILTAASHCSSSCRQYHLEKYCMGHVCIAESKTRCSTKWEEEGCYESQKENPQASNTLHRLPISLHLMHCKLELSPPENSLCYAARNLEMRVVNVAHSTRPARETNLLAPNGGTLVELAASNVDYKQCAHKQECSMLMGCCDAPAFESA
jgi:hypothetical protein